MKKVVKSLSIVIIAGLAFFNANISINEVNDLDLNGANAIACEMMEDIGGSTILLMEDCTKEFYAINTYMGTLKGCEDGGDRCSNYDY